jgi:FKBP-type peptidyl-prolyl cis-trans isomerase FklB
MTCVLVSSMSILSACDLFRSGGSPLKLDNDESKMSYALGLQVGSTVSKQGLPMKEDAFLQGYRDGFTKSEPKLQPAEIQSAVMKVQEYALKKEAGNGGTTTAEENLKIGAAYLEENKSKPNVKTTASGLQYEIIKKGNGEFPTDNSKVKVHYVGKLLSGTTFDSSRDRKQPAVFAVNQVVPGWIEGLKLMKPGAHFKLTIPPELAYGRAGAPPLVAPNSVLLFDVELLSIESDTVTKK